MLSIEVKGNKAAQAALSHAPGVMLRNIGKGLNRAAQELARSEKHAAPKAFSTLANSMHVTRRDPLTFEVAPGVNYAADIEFGTGPGVMPSVQSILEWVRVKRIEPDDEGMSARDLAFMIARGIRDHGILPNPFFFPTVDKTTPRIHEIVHASINAGIEQAFSK